MNFSKIILSLRGAASFYGDKDYLKKISSYKFWNNNLSTAVSQPEIGKMVWEFIDGKNDGRPKKVAFIGYDGCRADALPKGMKKTAAVPNFNIDGANPKNAALAKIKNDGGYAYIAYAGGGMGEANQQITSTAPGWASMLTGVWGIENGVYNSSGPKSINYKTFMLRAAEEKGLRGAFAGTWEDHFTATYIDEINYLKSHPDIPMEYKRLDTDEQLHEYMLSCLEEGGDNEKDILFGMYEYTDSAGHGTGFGNDNDNYVGAFVQSDKGACRFLEAIESRPSFGKEDWLILITTDHGGIKRRHGGQNAEERTTWVFCNKKIDKKHFSKNYDGYNEKV